MRVVVRWLLLLSVGVLPLTLLPAHAHDIVVRSHPARDASVRRADIIVEIAYSGRIDISRSRLA